MLGSPRINRPAGDEAEKPFWISFADLMTALMVLFLVVMLASLLSLTTTVTDLQAATSKNRVLANKYREGERERIELRKVQIVRQRRINAFWNCLERRTKRLGVRIDRTKSTIDFGDRARFKTGSDVLSPNDQLLLRRFTPALLEAADSPAGRAVVDRAVVEGYADRRGSYLSNLNLSLDRSQRVLCALLGEGRAALPTSQKLRVRDLFLVGGFSSNKQRQSLAASRRVEVRIEFFEAKDRPKRPPKGSATIGDCALGS